MCFSALYIAESGLTRVANICDKDLCTIMTSEREKIKTISWKQRRLLQIEDWLWNLGQESDKNYSHLTNIVSISGAPELSACGVVGAANRSRQALRAVWEMEETTSSVVILSCLCSAQICFICHLCLFAEATERWHLFWDEKLYFYLTGISVYGTYNKMTVA